MSNVISIDFINRKKIVNNNQSYISEIIDFGDFDYNDKFFDSMADIIENGMFGKDWP